MGSAKSQIRFKCHCYGACAHEPDGRRTRTRRYASCASYTPRVSFDLCRSAITKYRES